MGPALDELTIHGFKSIERLEKFPLRNLNVMIGANGAGKSNFLSVFDMLAAMKDGRLRLFVNDEGGGDGLFFGGTKVTVKFGVSPRFGDASYECEFAPSHDDGLFFRREEVRTNATLPAVQAYGTGTRESEIFEERFWSGEPSLDPVARRIADAFQLVARAISGWVTYHFHDTGRLAPMRREHSARDSEKLRTDGENLAAFLLRLREKHRGHYDLIRDTIRLAAPFFKDFVLRPEERGGEEKLRLEWREKRSDFAFQPVHMSDGTLRFACLVTALRQPEPPSTIIIDEPELGLHPFALNLVAEMIKAAAEQTQVIVATQSPRLVDCFAPEDVIVVSREDGRSRFERLDESKLRDWLTDYSLGELWEKNVIEGGPRYE